jgi:hypothetical protein
VLIGLLICTSSAFARKAHDYSLQVIAFENCPGDDLKDTNRREIAVKANYNYRSCEDDESEYCEDDADCATGAVCVELGECADGTKCEEDAECWDNSCVAGYCDHDGSIECTHDFDCNINEWGQPVFCGAGVVPHGKDWNDITKVNKIFLAPGDFWVEDGNACDDDGAKFHLPAPGSYTIWVRLVGKPGTGIGVTTCAVDDTDHDIYCSLDNVIRVRSKGKSTFTNVTSALTEMVVCLDDEGCDKRNEYTTVTLF